MHFRSRIWILIPYFSPAHKMLVTILLWSISGDKYSAFTQNTVMMERRVRGLTLFSSYTPRMRLKKCLLLPNGRHCY